MTLLTPCPFTLASRSGHDRTAAREDQARSDRVKSDYRSRQYYAKKAEEEAAAAAAALEAANPTPSTTPSTSTRRAPGPTSPDVDSQTSGDPVGDVTADDSYHSVDGEVVSDPEAEVVPTPPPVMANFDEEDGADGDTAQQKTSSLKIDFDPT